MHILIAIALKSLLVAGATLGLLALLKRRSAAERSWVAHIGLLALIVIAFAPLVLPRWNVATPALFSAAQPEIAAPSPASPVVRKSPLPDAATPAAVRMQTTAPIISPAAATAAIYAVPAAILLLITFLALARLIALRARAEVLVDGHWLRALAMAQRRMGFKHGTALLTSDELGSPISWGLMRPVILLNTRAVEAAGEAEAIIAHELAHVARLDWAKLMLARLATALFWFNPLVWVLAREAHQLREEAADDAVLGANIADTDYAQLLVGVARHECSGLLLGAHGVAPSKSSLARRVARVLDNASARGPAARSFALGVFTGAILIAAPLAALTLTPANVSDQLKPVKATSAATPTTPYYAAEPAPADLPNIIADGVSTAVAAISAKPVQTGLDAREAALQQADQTRQAAVAQALATAEQARAKAVKIAAAHGDHDIDSLIEMHAVGISPEYVAAMRAAAPGLAKLSPEDFVGLKSVGVTPDYARDLVAAGFRNIDEDGLTEARATGLTGSYVKAMTSAGVRGNIDDFVQLYVVGVRPEFVQRLRSAGYTTNDPDKLVELQAVGGDMLGYHPPRPPSPPGTPRPPATPRPPNVEPGDDSPGSS